MQTNGSDLQSQFLLFIHTIIHTLTCAQAHTQTHTWGGGRSYRAERLTRPGNPKLNPKPKPKLKTSTVQ